MDSGEQVEAIKRSKHKGQDYVYGYDDDDDNGQISVVSSS